MRWIWRRPPSRVGALPARRLPAQTGPRACLIGRVASRFHPARALRPEPGFSAMPAECSRTRGPTPASRLASLPIALESAMRAVLAYAHPRELFPGSIRSSTSCHRAASISGGWPDTSDRGRRVWGRPHRDLPGSSDPAAQTSYPRSRANPLAWTVDLRAPVRPARAGRSRRPCPLFRGGF